MIFPREKACFSVFLVNSSNNINVRKEPMSALLTIFVFVFLLACHKIVGSRKCFCFVQFTFKIGICIEMLCQNGFLDSLTSRKCIKWCKLQMVHTFKFNSVQFMSILQAFALPLKPEDTSASMYSHNTHISVLDPRCIHTYIHTSLRTSFDTAHLPTH